MAMKNTTTAPSVNRSGVATRKGRKACRSFR
jgi:hypothetical protein